VAYVAHVIDDSEDEEAPMSATIDGTPVSPGRSITVVPAKGAKLDFGALGLLTVIDVVHNVERGDVRLVVSPANATAKGQPSAKRATATLRTESTRVKRSI
jgi:hypothetical protein